MSSFLSQMNAQVKILYPVFLTIKNKICTYTYNFSELETRCTLKRFSSKLRATFHADIFCSVTQLTASTFDKRYLNLGSKNPSK